jgi:hypothetical protein
MDETGQTDEVTGATAWLTGDVTGAAAWLTVDVTGAAAWVTVAAACDTAVEAWLTVEPTGAACETGCETVCEADEETGAEAASLVPDTTPLTTPETVPVTDPSRFPAGSGAEDASAAGAARLVVEACALDPDSSQQTAIRPRQQPVSTRPRTTVRPAQFRLADVYASGAYSTPVQPPMIAATAT